MASTTLTAPLPAAGWLRDRRFDLALIGGVLVLALVLGTLANAGAGWFAAVLWVDVWFLAYPHVASMWMYVLADPARTRRHWFLWTALPPLVLFGTASVATLGGALALNTLYYHWQSWHYTRQSYGIARAYQRSGGVTSRDWLTDAVVFGFPVWGWLHRCAQGSTNFFGGPLFLPAVPPGVANAAGVVAVTLLGAWLARTLRDPSLRDRPGHVGFVLSHVAITFVSYIAVTEITRGWIFVNIWHNAQYLLFVWARNAGAPERAKHAWVYRPRNWLVYTGLCLAASTVAYSALGLTVEALGAWWVGATLVLHQSVNFHHYVVDAVIWKRGAAPARAAA